MSDEEDREYCSPSEEERQLRYAEELRDQFLVETADNIKSVCKPVSHCYFLSFCLKQLIRNYDIVSAIVRLVHETTQSQKVRMCIEVELNALGAPSRENAVWGDMAALSQAQLQALVQDRRWRAREEFDREYGQVDCYVADYCEPTHWEAILDKVRRLE